MDTYAHAREAFNRASHSDALPEMQLVPAEAIQRDPTPDEHPVITLRFGVVLAVLSAVLMGVHLAWVHAGMPGPSEILTAIMEALS